MKALTFLNFLLGISNLAILFFFAKHVVGELEYLREVASKF